MKNMVILDNIIFDLQKIGGISNYWYNLLKESAGNDNIFYFEDNCASSNYYRNLINIPKDRCIEDKTKMPLKIKRYLPVKNIEKSSNNIFHSSYYRYATGKIKNVTTVHDFMYEKYLSKYNIKRLIHSFQKYQAIKHSDYIIGVSKNTLNDVLKYFPEFKNKKMQVIYHGISDGFYSIKKKRQFIIIQNQKLWNNSYFFYFGNRKGYKNFNLLLNSYFNLLKNNKNTPKLVVASGGKFSKSEKILLSEMGISSSIIKLDRLTNDELNNLYNYCTGFVYPSLYEGFGIPVLEAMRAGAPVICSNSSSIPEVAGEAAIFIDPFDVFSLEKALFSLLDNSTRKNLISMSYKQVKKYSWGKTYKETLEIYNSI